MAPLSSAGSAREQFETLIEPREEVIHPDRAEPCGRELDGQGDPVEVAAQLGDRGRVVLGELEGGPGPSRPGDEQRTRGGARNLAGGGVLRGNGQGSELPDVLVG